MEILDRGQREFSGFARGRFAEVKGGVVEAEWLATQRGGVALAAVGQIWRHSMSMFVLRGVYPHTLGLKLPVSVT